MALKRVQVSLSENDYLLVKRLSELQGEPMSKVVGGMFESISPVLERVCVVLEAASKAQLEATEGLKAQGEQMLAEIEPLMAAALGQFDMFVGAVGEASGASQPPHSNTGVRSARKAKPKAKPKAKSGSPKKSVRGAR